MTINNFFNLLTSFVFLLLLFGGKHHVNCIECYQCLSTDHDNPFQCTEILDDNVDLKPSSCSNVFNAAYCIKQVGRFEGGLGTKRFCSSLDLGNYCNYIQQPGDDLEYRSCVFTCDSDGCNAANIKLPSIFIFVVLGIIVTKIYM